jgi:hypothetical protein
MTRKATDVVTTIGIDIERVEPGKVWLTNIAGGRQLVPISLPTEATELCQAGWTVSGAIRRIGRKWVLVEAWNVYS